MIKLKIMNHLMRKLCFGPVVKDIYRLYSYRCRGRGRGKIFAPEFLDTTAVVAVIRRSKIKNFFFLIKLIQE